MAISVCMKYETSSATAEDSKELQLRHAVLTCTIIPAAS